MFEQVSYGDHKDQFIRIYPPSEPQQAAPAVFVIHGGFWRQKYNIDNALVDGFPSYFGSRGWWTINVEYRRGNKDVDDGEGGWPNTNQDILLALQALANCAENDSKYSSLDMNQLVIMGHSAGGTLAMWASSSNLPAIVAQVPLFQSIRLVQPKLCVAMAPIGDLVSGQLRRLSDDGMAIALYMKAEPLLTVDNDTTSLSSDSPYRLASPHFHVPLSCSSIFVTGEKDVDVPEDLVITAYEHCADASAASTTPMQLLNIREADHYSMVTVSTEHWQQIYDAIATAMQLQ